MREVSEIKYQTSTMDTGILEVLYEGNDMAEAVQACLDYEGKCSIRHFLYNGTVRDVVDYANGQAIRAYAYV